jgi:hypothetical protein
MQTSTQWRWERGLGGTTTDCLNVLSPKNRNQDISITLLVGFEAGMQLVEQFQLRKLDESRYNTNLVSGRNIV